MKGIDTRKAIRRVVEKYKASFEGIFLYESDDEEDDIEEEMEDDTESTEYN